MRRRLRGASHSSRFVPRSRGRRAMKTKLDGDVANAALRARDLGLINEADLARLKRPYVTRSDLHTAQIALEVGSRDVDVANLSATGLDGAMRRQQVARTLVSAVEQQLHAQGHARNFALFVREAL